MGFLKNDFLQNPAFYPTELDFSGVWKLPKLCDHFLSNNKLQSLDLSSFQKLRVIDKDCLEDSFELEVLDLSNLHQLELINPGFLKEDTPHLRIIRADNVSDRVFNLRGCRRLG